ncbi:MAG: response regulator transcription factor [Clostridia bacterium]|nr:response regulator transcription factor [Clostridia bacterium]
MKKEIEIYMCDDDESFMKSTSLLIMSLIGENRSVKITEFSDGDSLIKQCETTIPDVVFLDIDMPRMSGFEIADKLHANNMDICIIFLTSYDDMVYQSWTYQPFWFIRKSCLQDFKTVIPRLLTKIDSIHENYNSNAELIIHGKNYLINLKTVSRICSFKHYIHIEDISGRIIEVRAKISDIKNQLSDMHFTQIQKGVIVNLRFVHKITSRCVVFHDGTKHNISRLFLKNCQSDFQRYIRSK